MIFALIFLIVLVGIAALFWYLWGPLAMAAAALGAVAAGYLWGSYVQWSDARRRARMNKAKETHEKIH